ncbi:Levanase [Emticicia aquatica]|uniref:Levanase n=1 Tax=Emticicia aquatica TaxID=1681835 RepID=A0ABN8ETA6_9BACT|nr:glycoside hydrolase family 32 protein [Emticicia aquatica]CAH0995171.1 Levanase [Emticicia aquatica]
MRLTFLSLAIIFCLACEQKSKTDTFYQEQHRPQFHFSPEKGWMNDPNGLVYYEGEYHLFYQHYPDSTVWGPMHWGHAISKDLTTWEHLPIALYPDSLGYIFSGSIVVDENNTTGFQTGKEKPLVAIFTLHDMVKEKAGRNDRESQGIAYSLDKGRTWTKYEKNPVLANKGDADFRDPKVFWHEATKHWVMPLAVGQHLEIFTSPNLKDWEKTGEFGNKDGAHGGVWECPDIISLKAEDGVEKWVLIQNIGRGAINGGSGTQYFVGTFHGKTFINDNPPETTLWLDYGADNYAGVTWFNAPNNEKIFIGWMSNWDDYATKVPTSSWRSAMTVPRKLSLIKTSEGYRLAQMPVTQIEKLRLGKTEISKQTISNDTKIGEKSVLKEINLSFDLTTSTANEFGFILSNSLNEKVVLGYDKTTKQVFIDRTNAGKSDFSKLFAKKHLAPLNDDKELTIKALVDNSSIEVFVNGGKIALTDLFFPNEDYTQLSIYSKGGNAELIKGEIYPLKSIWKK